MITTPLNPDQHTRPSHKRTLSNARKAWEMYQNGQSQKKIAAELEFSVPYISNLIMWFTKHLEFLEQQKQEALKTLEAQKQPPIYTSDAATVACLRTLGHMNDAPFVEKNSWGKEQVVFPFPNGEEVMLIIDDFLSHKLTVDPLAFINNYRAVVRMIHDILGN